MKIDEKKTNSMHKIRNILSEYEDFTDQIDLIAQTLIKICIYYQVEKESFMRIMSDYYDDLEELSNLMRFPTVATTIKED